MENDSYVTGATQDVECVFDIGDLTAQNVHDDAPFIQHTLFDEQHHGDILDDKPLFSLQRADEDSDGSWTQKDDHGRFYVNISRQLHLFAASISQTTLTLPLLSRQQRHFVHATAQILGLGHASLVARGKYKQMVVYKSDSTSVTRPVSPPPTRCETLVNLHNDHFRSLATYEPNEDILSTSLPKKRKRLQRSDAGFPCTHTGCTRLFDRASERTKHEQCHSTTFTEKHACLVCKKGFRYPKDLRRHQKVHDDGVSNGGSSSSGSGSSAVTGTTTTSSARTSSLSTTPVTSSAFTLESRVPSDTSLTFSSRPVSTNSSPTLAAIMSGDLMGDVEPLALDHDQFAAAMEQAGGFAVPLESFIDLDFDDKDDNDGGILEMVRVRR